jgi:glycosyltransferase involved in cell wall biosynthesis
MNSAASPSILFFTKHSRMGASSRYRTYQYLPYLEGAGFNCVVCPLFDEDYLVHLYLYGKPSLPVIIKAIFRRVVHLTKVRKFDLLVIEKEIFPYLPSFATSMLTWMGIRYVVDYDDALFHQYDQHPQWLIRAFLGKKIAHVMQGADLVIAGNPYLAAYARKAGSENVKVVPTVVDLAKYPDKPTKARDGTFTIGWIGSPSTTKYLEAIAPALAQVCSGGKARVLLIGSGPCVLPNVPVDILPWEELTEVEALRRFDVGIMPLPDEPWEHGKCGLKLIQYMACSVPVVASPVGANLDIVEPSTNGFLAIGHASWVEALTTLRDNEDFCSKLGQAGRAKVAEEYSLQVTSSTIVRYLSEAARIQWQGNDRDK